MIIQEKTVLEFFDSAKKVLLIEPPVNAKYPPFALAKIKTYLEKRGTVVKFANTILPEKFDLICVTTLFTYHSKVVFTVLKNRGFFNSNTPIIVGGIFATLMPKEFDKFKNVHVFQGYSKVLDRQVLDQEIINCKHNEKWDGFHWTFTTRSCPNNCAYCVVPKIEKDYYLYKDWQKVVPENTKNLSILDNNISAAPLDHVQSIADFVSERKMRLLIESGVDCKYVTKDLAKILAGIKYVRHGMRTAFDRIEEDGTFQKAAELLQKTGVNPEDMMAYVLFNFNDRPKDADHRASECYRLKIRAYPQCFAPLNSLDKPTFIGKHWTLRLGKAFRGFWIMKGIRHGFPDTDFDEFIKSKQARKQYKITSRDIDCWNSNGK